MVAIFSQAIQDHYSNLDHKILPLWVEYDQDNTIQAITGDPSDEILLEYVFKDYLKSIAKRYGKDLDRILDPEDTLDEPNLWINLQISRVHSYCKDCTDVSVNFKVLTGCIDFQTDLSGIWSSVIVDPHYTGSNDYNLLAESLLTDLIQNPYAAESGSTLYEVEFRPYCNL